MGSTPPTARTRSSSTARSRGHRTPVSTLVSAPAAWSRTTSSTRTWPASKSRTALASMRRTTRPLTMWAAYSPFSRISRGTCSPTPTCACSTTRPTATTTRTSQSLAARLQAFRSAPACSASQATASRSSAIRSPTTRPSASVWRATSSTARSPNRTVRRTPQAMIPT